MILAFYWPNYFFIIVVFQGLGLLACFGSEFIFCNLSIYWTVGRTPWRGDRPDARPLPTHRTTQHRKTRTHIHASSGIRNHDPSVRAAEDSTCLRPLGHWDQPNYFFWSTLQSSISDIYIYIKTFQKLAVGQVKQEGYLMPNTTGQKMWVRGPRYKQILGENLAGSTIYKSQKNSSVEV
jgi:hypothetical protein